MFIFYVLFLPRNTKLRHARVPWIFVCYPCLDFYLLLIQLTVISLVANSTMDHGREKMVFVYSLYLPHAKAVLESYTNVCTDCTYLPI